MKLTAATSVRGKLKLNSNNAWVEFPSSAGFSPIRRPDVGEAGYGMDSMAGFEIIPFATGAEREPVSTTFA